MIEGMEKEAVAVCWAFNESYDNIKKGWKACSPYGRTLLLDRLYTLLQLLEVIAPPNQGYEKYIENHRSYLDKYKAELSE